MTRTTTTLSRQETILQSFVSFFLDIWMSSNGMFTDGSRSSSSSGRNVFARISLAFSSIRKKFPVEGQQHIDASSLLGGGHNRQWSSTVLPFYFWLILAEDWRVTFCSATSCIPELSNLSKHTTHQDHARRRTFFSSKELAPLFYWGALLPTGNSHLNSFIHVCLFRDVCVCACVIQTTHASVLYCRGGDMGFSSCLVGPKKKKHPLTRRNVGADNTVRCSSIKQHTRHSVFVSIQHKADLATALT
jgi:hypothetical protein